MDVQTVNMVALQEMVESMKAVMEAMGLEAQKKALQGPAKASKGQPSEALVVPDEGPELPEDGPEAPAKGLGRKGPRGEEDITKGRDKGKPKTGEMAEPEAERTEQNPKQTPERS